MNDTFLKIYHHMPGFFRDCVASTRGYYLRYWRYGQETERIVEEALERENWTTERWKCWQEERLAYVLDHAAKNVPFYRSLWAKKRQSGDRSSWERIENWPILKKETIRKNHKGFLSGTIESRKLFELHTSGTTGKPVKLWRGKNTNRNWYALNEARLKRWYALNRNDRWGILGGQLIVPFKKETPPFWVWNAGMKQLYMSSYHLNAQNAESYLAAIEKYNLVYLLGYASSLYSLALAILSKNMKASKLKVLISNAEPLFEHQRKLIQKAFGCPVRNTYGMTEAVAAGSECSHGTMHIWPEVGFIEIFDSNGHHLKEDCATGRITCTGLLNKEMPLVRYEVGDIGSLAPHDKACECGRCLPILSSIEGRCDDVIFTKDGRRIGRLDPVFKGDFPILEAQIIQENLSLIRIRYVPSPNFEENDEKVLIERMRDRVGDMKIVLDPVSFIPRSANGKFQAVISKISDLEIM